MSPIEDLFVLDLAALKWTQVAVHEHTPLQRHAHCTTADGDGNLLMFGGIDELDTPCPSLYRAELPLPGSTKALRFTSAGNF